MTALKHLAYVSVVAGIALAVNPTGKYGLGAESSSAERNPVDSILENRNYAGAWPRPKHAVPMPPTSCRSVEPVPKPADTFSEAHGIHDGSVLLFVHASGFGRVRMFTFENDRGVEVSSRDVDRVELVSLLTESEPSVYVLNEMATPALARQAKRRPLDKFERLGLDAVRCGEDLVWTPEAPTRMFGAIRAWKSCVDCHKSAREGDLLGAFTYYLNTPVDQLNDK
jgi:hypothetical protein